MKKLNNTRRIPKQKRSKERVERILDCAAELMRENGPDKVSTHAVAERAGMAVGSLYQFFPNIEIIKIALVERVMNQLFLNVLETLEECESSTLLDLTMAMIDSILSFYERNKDVVQTIIVSRHSEAFVLVNDKVNERVIEAIVNYIRRHDKTMKEDDIKRKVQVSVGFGDAMMVLVWSENDLSKRNKLVYEWKLLARTYAENLHSIPDC